MGSSSGCSTQEAARRCSICETSPEVAEWQDLEESGERLGEEGG